MSNEDYQIKMEFKNIRIRLLELEVRLLKTSLQVQHTLNKNI